MNESGGSTDFSKSDPISSKYQLCARLGEGGMGVVYKAIHTGINRPVAIKFLHAHLARNEEFVSRFQREAQSAGSLLDENIVSVTDFGVTDEGAPYLVMEYLTGESLAELICKEGSLPAPRAIYMVIQACRGLSVAHGKGIVHRDLKPENLFVCKRNNGDDLLKILDFGIAKLRTGNRNTETGTTMGTPFYMSPEQARGTKDIDQRTDVYSLGVILFEMLAGIKPFKGCENLEIIYNVLNVKPPALDSVCPGLPAGLSAVVGKAMSSKVEERYSSVLEFMQSLVPYAGRTVTPILTTSDNASVGRPAAPNPLSVPAMPGTPPSRDVITSKASKRFTKHRLVILVALSVVASLVVFISFRMLIAEPFLTEKNTKNERITSMDAASPLLPTSQPALKLALIAPVADASASHDATIAVIKDNRPPGRPGGQLRTRPDSQLSEVPDLAKKLRRAQRSSEASEISGGLPSSRRNIIPSINRNNPFNN